MGRRSYNRLFADQIRSMFSVRSDDTNLTDTVSVFTTTSAEVTSASTATIDTISESSATAVTFYVDATNSVGDHHFAILSATVDSAGAAVYNEYGTMITNSSLATFAVDINSNNFRLLATTTTSGITFKVTRVVVPV